MSVEPIYLDNDYEPEYTLTRKNASTGASEAATGLSGLTVRVSATKGGATIHASLSKTLAERGTLGIYYARLEGDDLRAQLATYIGQKVYLVAGDGTNIFGSDAVSVHATRTFADV